jgi:hypothetical protein
MIIPSSVLLVAAIAGACALVLLVVALMRNDGLRTSLLTARYRNAGFREMRSSNRRPLEAVNELLAHSVYQQKHHAESSLRTMLRRFHFGRLEQRWHHRLEARDKLAKEIAREVAAAELGQRSPRHGTIPTPLYFLAQTIVCLGDILLTSLGLQSFHLSQLAAWILAFVFGTALAILGDRAGSNLKSPHLRREAVSFIAIGILFCLSLTALRVHYLTGIGTDSIWIQAFALGMGALVLFSTSVIVALHHKRDLEHQLLGAEHALRRARSAHDRVRSAYNAAAHAQLSHSHMLYGAYKRGAQRGWMQATPLVFPELKIDIPIVEPLVDPLEPLYESPDIQSVSIIDQRGIVRTLIAGEFLAIMAPGSTRPLKKVSEAKDAVDVKPEIPDKKTGS